MEGGYMWVNTIIVGPFNVPRIYAKGKPLYRCVEHRDAAKVPIDPATVDYYIPMKFRKEQTNKVEYGPNWPSLQKYRRPDDKSDDRDEKAVSFRFGNRDTAAVDLPKLTPEMKRHMDVNFMNSLACFAAMHFMETTI